MTFTYAGAAGYVCKCAAGVKGEIGHCLSQTVGSTPDWMGTALLIGRSLFGF